MIPYYNVFAHTYHHVLVSLYNNKINESPNKPKRKSIIPKHTRYIDIETVVVIVGARPAGLATSVCLNQHSIPNVILKKEDIYASICRYGDCSGELVIVGAGPAGLATSVCLNQHSIPNVILGKENINASFGKK
ncbi:hypothetical protein YC2023_045632 [Brassica napus]